jgi:hypothetical protein
MLTSESLAERGWPARSCLASLNARGSTRRAAGENANDQCGRKHATFRTFEMLPRRIFLDSCTAQTLRDYGGLIYEDEPIDADDRIRRITDGLANLEALHEIFRLTERGQFERIISTGSLVEAADKCDSEHFRWLWDIAHHSQACLEANGLKGDSTALAIGLWSRDLAT